MPKYIKKRKRGERIEHHFFYGNEYKTCSICNQWKPLDQFGKNQASWDEKRSECKPCGNKKQKQRDKQRRKVIKEQLKKEREAAPTGFLVCLNAKCTVKELQPLDQFIHSRVHNDKPTDICKTCRDKVREAQILWYAPCEKVYQNWRKTHPCVKCMNDPNYKHNSLLIEADHLGGKVVKCSLTGYWSAKCRGPDALRAELTKCQAVCKFHHRLVTQQRRHDNGRIEKKKWRLRKRAIMYAEKHNRGCCLRCKRVVKKGEECAFDFDHRDPTTKFTYNGKAVHPSDFRDLPDALFATQWPLEQAKCDLLCVNCHMLKNNRDGYRK